MNHFKKMISLFLAVVCCGVYMAGINKKEKIVLVSLEERALLELVLLDDEGNLVPVMLELPFVMDEAQSIICAIEYMRENHQYNGLYGFLNASAAINSVEVNEDVANVDVNKSFFTLERRKNRRIAEALVSVIKANTTINEIVLSEEGMLLENIPYTDIEVKDMVYSLPINVFESAGALHSSIPFTTYTTRTIGKNTLLIPRTYYTKGRKSLAFVMLKYEEALLNAGLFEKLGKLFNSYSLEKAKLKLDLNATLCFEEGILEETVLNLLLLMLFDNLPIQSVELSIDGEEYLYEKRLNVIRRKDLVYNVWKI